MLAAKEFWETIKEGLTKAIAKSNLDWIEHNLGIKPGKFAEHVAVEVVAALLVLTIVGLTSFFASRSIWRAIRRKFRAATIRRTASNSFVIIRCPIANDSNEAIGNEIAGRLETAFRAFAGWGEVGGRPFHVMEFPLPLSGDEGTKAYDASIETAKRWLERTDGDILIWGKRVKGESIGIIRLIGRDRKKGVIEVRRVNFDKRADEFDQALAIAIAYEAAQLTQITLSEPELVQLDVLREVARKLENLATSTAPALSNMWRRRMSAEHWHLTEEIVRRSGDPQERERLEVEARARIVKLDPTKDPHRFAETALRIGTLIRKRNWANPIETELYEASTFVESALSIFKSVGDDRRSFEAALERMSIRRKQLLFLKKTNKFETDEIYTRNFQEAQRLKQSVDDQRQHLALIAASFALESNSMISAVCDLDKDAPVGAFTFVSQISPYVDNGEMIDLVDTIKSAIFRRGDRTENPKFWIAARSILQATLNLRSSWTQDERFLLNAMISDESKLAAYRFETLLGSEAAAPFWDLSVKLAHELFASLEKQHRTHRRYVDLRILSNLDVCSSRTTELLVKGIDALRICTGVDAARFPNLREAARSALIVGLNNSAIAFSSFAAAEEALQLALSRNEELGEELRSYDRYIAAFAAWQVARLAPNHSPKDRDDELGRRAWAAAEQALRLATDEENRYFVSVSHELLRDIEADFPELAVDLDSEAMSAGTSSIH